jgi:predicted nucleic acid-binding protein
VKQTFADSFYLLALFNGSDAAHDRALKASAELEGTLVTSDWVLAETADALCDPLNRNRCVEFLDDLRRSTRVVVEPASRMSFDAGWKLYRERPDKEWSLTDCISFVLMQKYSIRDALTGDHHFEQTGFRALLRQ